VQHATFSRAGCRSSHGHLLSALLLAIAMGTFPALTRTRVHLCCRRCIVNCVPRAEIQQSSPASVSRFCPREQLARAYCPHRFYFPSTFLLFDLASFFLSSMGAPTFSRTRSLTSNRLTSASTPVMRHSGYGTWACVPSWYRLSTFSESRTPAVWFSSARHLLLPSFFFSI
jgi:hypothetical protein